jgi:hypothetical protein
MIYINHEKKAIFIHIPKTGGSYIGHTLEKYYGFTSYLSLMYRKKKDHNILCKQPQIISGNKIYDNSFFNREIGIFSYFKTCDEYNDIMNMNDEKWNTYTKFCFIRNPYDRALSGWNHFNKILNLNIDFHDYLLDEKNVSDIEYGHIFMNQTSQITNEKKVCGVDIIGRFEYLEEDFRVILEKFGFNIIHPVKKVNVSNQLGSENIVLERKTVNLLNNLFKEDFDNLHYVVI